MWEEEIDVYIENEIKKEEMYNEELEKRVKEYYKEDYDMIEYWCS
jgi:hypothetical protein